jgi:hypothetical protein
MSVRPTIGPSRLHKHVATYVTNIPSEDWNRIKTCVVCNAKWTARKSAKGKIDHLRSCTTKHFSTDETVERLIQEQLAVLDVVSAPTKPQPVEKSKSLEPSTLLDDAVFVSNPPPRKRQPRKVAQPITSIAEASGDWGQTPLSKSGAPEERVTRPHFEGLVSENADEIHATQQQLISQVATSSKPRLLGELASHDHASESSFPSTQQLPPSRLAFTSNATGSTLSSYKSLIEMASSYHDESPAPSTLHKATTSASYELNIVRI